MRARETSRWQGARSWVHRSKASAVLLALLLVGCGEQADVFGSPSIGSNIVTAELHEQMSRDGRFRPSPVPEQDFEQIDLETAGRLANAYVRTFGVISEGRWSALHGSAVDGRALKQCGRILFARSAYELRGEALPPALRNFIAGTYLVQFCSPAQQPQLFVSVSEAASDIRILEDGRLEFPPSASHLVYGQAIPREIVPDLAVPSAERAAEIAASRTGLRVAEVPLLLRAPFPHSPMFSRWRVKLERPLMVKGLQSKREMATDVVYVGLAIGVHASATALIATSADSTSAAFDELPLPFSAPSDRQVVRLPRASSAPRDVEPWEFFTGRTK